MLTTELIQLVLEALILLLLFYRAFLSLTFGKKVGTLPRKRTLKK